MSHHTTAQRSTAQHARRDVAAARRPDTQATAAQRVGFAAAAARRDGDGTGRDGGCCNADAACRPTLGRAPLAALFCAFRACAATSRLRKRSTPAPRLAALRRRVEAQNA
jgi:hypothetical protein